MNNSNSDTNIFFYSENCKFCYNLMKLLNNMNILKNFMLIKTDNNPNLPPQIHSVPTLIVMGHPKMLVCNEAFKWVNGLIQIKQDQSQATMKNQKNIYIMSELMNKNKNKNDPTGAEKIIFSDLFTFVDDNNNAQMHNFVNPSNKLSHIFTAPEISKLTKKNQLNEINNAIKERDKQDDYYKEYMKQFHDENTLKKCDAISTDNINKKTQNDMKKKLIMKQILQKKKNK